MDNTFFINQVDGIISEYQKLKSKAEEDDLSGNTEIEEIQSIISKVKACIVRIAGEDSVYYSDVMEILQKKHLYEGAMLRQIMGCFIALKSDLENNYLKTLSEIIHSDIFVDYLEMAKYLVGEGWKDPAAVIAGSTLESHVRELCKSNGISIEFVNSSGKSSPKKADMMNNELAKQRIYTSAYQKQVTAWLDLRNNAAHGKYDTYSLEEIKLMISGIYNFITSNPA